MSKRSSLVEVGIGPWEHRGKLDFQWDEVLQGYSTSPQAGAGI